MVDRLLDRESAAAWADFGSPCTQTSFCVKTAKFGAVTDLRGSKFSGDECCAHVGAVWRDCLAVV